MKRKDNVFSQVFTPPIEQNRFDLSHDKKLTCNMGELIPVTCLEVLPGDEFNISFVNMFRCLPLVSPVMHKIKIYTEYFFVPNRILWDGWEDFITGVNNPNHPFVRIDDVIDKGTVADYLGIPPGDYSDKFLNVNMLQLAAYYKIYDEWYRDQNMITEKSPGVVQGSNTANWLTLLNGQPLRRAWEHDYFTSALPFTQQGSTDVEIPLTFENDIPVEYTGASGTPGKFLDADSPHAGLVGDVVTTTGGVVNVSPDTGGAVYDPNGTLTVDVQSSAATINDLREAFSLQAFLERSIRGGVRYVEQLFSMWKVRSSDARLQRPEFIGRDIQTMVIGEVLATAQSNNDAATAEVPVGQMAGHGISVGGRDGLYFKAEEHGHIIGIISVIPDTAYQDGLARQFSKVDRLDYAFPDFAHLGEQEVRLKEIQAAVNNSHDPEAVFGYMPRYSEYRYEPSRVAGDFRDSLAYWTLGRIFNNPAAPPALNEEFIECNPRFDIFAVTDPDVDHIIGQVINKITVNRKLPRYGVPSTL